MDEQYFKYLYDKLESEVELNRQFLANGGAKDYAEYLRCCGVIRGLAQAQQHINDLVRKVKEEDDE